MPWSQTDRSFKTLINKRTTDSTGKFFFNEKGDFTLNTHASEIWLSPIPNDAPLSTTSVVEINTSLLLIEDTSVPNKQCWFATSNAATVSAQTDEASRLKNWISDKYNGPGSTRLYTVLLYDDAGNQISTADTVNWFFDYQTGILTFNPTNSTDIARVTTYASNGAGPNHGFKITGYRYVGTRGIGNGYLPLTGGALSGNLSFDATGNTSTDVYGLRLKNINLNTSPISGDAGSLLWDTNSSKPKIWNGSSWLTIATLGAGSSIVSGSGTDKTIPMWSGSSPTSNLADSILSQYLESGTGAQAIKVTGHFTATTKSFIVPYPGRPEMDLVHGCLEGPEHGMYQRGNVEGRGIVRVEFPDYWEPMVGQDYTLTLTACGNYQVYIVSQDSKGFFAARCTNWWEFWNRKKEFKFSYYAAGARQDARMHVMQTR